MSQSSEFFRSLADVTVLFLTGVGGQGLCNECSFLQGFGVMEGLRLLQFRAELKKTGVHMTDFKPDGGESIADVSIHYSVLRECLYIDSRSCQSLC